MYTKKEFLGLLKSRIPPTLPPRAYTAYCNYAEKYGKERYYHSDFQDAMCWMESLTLSCPEIRLSSQSTNAPEFAPVEITSQDILTSSILMEKIAPRIKKIRREIFKSSKPRFDWPGAIEWLEAESEKYKEKQPWPKEFMDKYDAAAKEAGKHNLRVRASVPILHYVKKYDGSESSEMTHSVHVRGPKLRILERETEYLSCETGLSQAVWVIHVLTGLKPSFPRIICDEIWRKLKISDSEILIRKEVVLTIRAKDLSFRELQRVYKEIKKMLAPEKQYPIRDKHLKIKDLIDKLGKPPQRGHPEHREYWKKAIKEWEKRYPDQKPNRWDNLRDAWERLDAKKEKLLTVDRNQL